MPEVGIERFGLAAFVLAVATVVALAGPIHRAARIDPMTVLRGE